jgi:hypothetical protein
MLASYPQCLIINLQETPYFTNVITIVSPDQAIKKDIFFKVKAVIIYSNAPTPCADKHIAIDGLYKTYDFTFADR